MSDSKKLDELGQPDQRRKTRTWWHPLLVSVVDYLSEGVFDVQEEMAVGQLPLRVDFAMLWNERRDLPPALKRDLAVLAERMERYNLVEYKAPTDHLEYGDLSTLIGCAYLFLGQQRKPLHHSEVRLFLLVPAITAGFEQEVAALGLSARAEQPGVTIVGGDVFPVWVIETVIAGRQHPLLALFSPLILQDPRAIMKVLSESGHTALLYYILQQIQQFQFRREDFAMQHTAVEYMDEVSEELKASVIAAIPAKDRLRGLTAEQILECVSLKEILADLPAEERLRGLPAEERLRGLSPAERRRLRDLLDQDPSSLGIGAK